MYNILQHPTLNPVLNHHVLYLDVKGEINPAALLGDRNWGIHDKASCYRQHGTCEICVNLLCVTHLRLSRINTELLWLAANATSMTYLFNFLCQIGSCHINALGMCEREMVKRVKI